MNSALQCLVRLADLIEIFLGNRHLKDLNVTNVLGSEGHIACAFGEFVKNFYTSGRKVL
jgi:ubiquitin C-terminal hydrolase